MKLIFAGTPDFARSALDALIAQGHEIVLVMTQPDRAAGRGLKLQPSAVKQLALQHNIPLLQPHSLKLDGNYATEAQAAQQQLTALVQANQAQAMIVAAYGLILPQWLLDLMQSQPQQLGCLNIHASLLPRWRGAAPIHRAIEAGDQQTGISIMQMDAGLDTGAVLLEQSIAIAAEDNCGSLHNKLAQLGGELIVQTLGEFAALTPQPQPDNGITYAEKISKAEAKIDWQQDALILERKIRAFNPFPGANTSCAGQTIKIWQAQLVSTSSQPLPAGTVVQADSNKLIVACGAAGSQRLQLNKLQKAGGKALASADFLRGFPLEVGSILGA